MYDPTGSSMTAATRKPAATPSKPVASKAANVDYSNEHRRTARESKSKAPVLGLNDPGYGDAPDAQKATDTALDVTKLSLAERSKLSRDLARNAGSKTDSRSVNERFRSSLGMKKGGAVKKMASGGMASSVSKRADGIAQKGKTRGKMC
jgi:hypothetical protein